MRSPPPEPGPRQAPLRPPARCRGNPVRCGAVPKRRPIPPVAALTEEAAFDLAALVAAASYLPHPAVVAQVSEARASTGGAVFPVSRGKIEKRTGEIIENGKTVGMHDDNTTPRWALLWAHGYGGVSKSQSPGWTFAHVWPTSGDRRAYTHLANLAMVPEYFGSLTDKQGPLTRYLRWHAHAVYGWRPEDQPVPEKPARFEDVVWRYFDPIEDPVRYIGAYLNTLGCQRSSVLRRLLAPQQFTEQQSVESR